MTRNRRLMFAVGAAVAGSLLTGSLIRATPTSTLVGRGTYANAFNVKRVDKSVNWQVGIDAKPNLDVAMQTIDFAAGDQSTWHTHPGPVFITVALGTMTFYESDDPNCEPTVREAGEGFLDVGDHAHIARNESGAPARNVVVYFAPPGKPLRVDQPNPGNCAFRGF